MTNGERVRLPFSLLTNGGGIPEKVKTDNVNMKMFQRIAPINSDDAILKPS